MGRLSASHSKIGKYVNMIEQKANQLKKYRLDIIFISSILLSSVLFFAIASFNKKEGAIAVVEINGVVTNEYSLYVDGTFSLNGGTNLLVIENGSAYISYSNCPDHICEKTKKIQYVGERIVCLPNRISITVNGSADNGVDLVS